MKKIALLLICIAMCCSIVACRQFSKNTSVKTEDKALEPDIDAAIHANVWIRSPGIAKEAQRIVDDPSIINSKVEFGQNPRRIYGIIIHSCGNPKTFDEAKELLRTVAWHGYSYHYIILDGQIHQMVDESKVAFHAGVSQFPNYPNKLHGVNEDTIGIALRTDMTDQDYEALAWLIKNIMLRDSNVKRELILNHKDVAPGRKTDHEKIDMKKLDQLIDWPKFEKQRTIYLFLCDVELCMKYDMWHDAWQEDGARNKFKQRAKDEGIYKDVEYLFWVPDGIG
jgi:N-acetyl-anhydromuramyl-L-alanine amidase AmpD